MTILDYIQYYVTHVISLLSSLPLGGGCGSNGWGGFWRRGAREAAESWACSRDGGGAWVGTVNAFGGGSDCRIVGPAFIMLGAWGWLWRRGDKEKKNRTRGDYMLKGDLKQSSVKMPMTAQQITGWTVQKPGQGLLERKKLGKALSVCLNEKSVGWKNIWCETKSQPRKLVFFSTVLLYDSFISNFSWIWQR